VSVRPARAEEFQTLADMAWAAKAFWNYPPAQMEAWREALSPSAASIVACPTFVAERNGTPAGFYQLRVMAPSAELEHLWVSPAWMGQGVGRALLAHALEHLEALGIASLHIDADPHAERFYARQGATRIGSMAAPIDCQPKRVRPQMRLTTQSCAHAALVRTGAQ
jgi:GNAT superfamily N-acetyltransferase